MYLPERTVLRSEWLALLILITGVTKVSIFLGNGASIFKNRHFRALKILRADLWTKVSIGNLRVKIWRRSFICDIDFIVRFERHEWSQWVAHEWQNIGAWTWFRTLCICAIYTLGISKALFLEKLGIISESQSLIPSSSFWKFYICCDLWGST